MGVRVSKNHDLLEGSDWLRTVVNNHQKSREGVAGFESFAVEPFFTYISDESHINDESDEDYEKSKPPKHLQDGGIVLRKVSVIFRKNKDNNIKEVQWIVKSANKKLLSIESIDHSVPNLYHEIKVYVSLLPEVLKFLDDQSNIKAKHLLNIPEYIFHERKCDDQGGNLVRCHLVLEDIKRTKNCFPINSSQVSQGLSVAQFRVFAGTLAQFHAVGMAFNCSRRTDDALLDTFPFLHRNKNVTILEVESRDKDRCLAMYEKLIRWQQRRTRHRYKNDEDWKRRIKLLTYFRTRANEIMHQGLSEGSDLKGLCIGPVLPNEVMVQYKNGAHLSKEDLRIPICAAITTCHRVHYGGIIRELAMSFFSLAEHKVRKDYLISMIQTYCYVITSTLEFLDVDWLRQFKVTFPLFLSKFQNLIGQAIFRAIIFHMRMTDPKELEKIVSNVNGEKTDHHSIGGGGGVSNKTHHHTNHSTRAHRHSATCDTSESSNFYIPLTEQRIEFLIHITDALKTII